VDPVITILATGANQRGDVFTRLMSDLFHSLGYEQLRFNVHQTGREVDIIGTHCTEHRMVVAECKAESEPIGGGDLNKFYGVLDAETRKTNIPTEGYFASITGFRESAIQQERDLGGRFALLDAKEIIHHLIRGRILINPKDAAAQASKWLEPTSPLEVKNIELLAHETGWYWLATFAKPGAVISGYSVVHADGYVLEQALGKDLVASRSVLAHLKYVGPDTQEIDTTIEEARSRYIEYLINEYGYITLEGLPADQEVGSRSLRLESIFVPLSLQPIASEITDDDAHDHPAPTEIIADPETEESEFEDDTYKEEDLPREPVGKVLTVNNRLALLGSPGSGKTTLLKRLAVAYAAPGRRTASDDLLPERDWFPVVIRCRHLGADVSRPLLHGIEGITERAEMPELGPAFRECVMRELRAGRVLLLVDGLDEIASPTDRSAFVSQLRTFLGTYPSASLVVTSREFGFRTVAGAVASLCTMYRVAELSAKDIRTITLAWHREVVGPSASVRANASALADSILMTDRVRRLALNPLLLTTLLLVRRWLGELPRKRSVLYAKAIEVLLMTWNVEGHQPLDPDEALPQLAFAAFSMMQENVQTVSIKELTGYFSEARRQMPELLGYSRISVSEFVSRVEERSSLLSLSGHVLEDGQLRATYEFKHLTFQEYLAALAAAQGYYPNRREGERLVDVLEPYIGKTSWREVVPLAGVLGGRSSSALVERIIESVGSRVDFLSLVREDTPRPRMRPEFLVGLLARCLADDVPLAPDTLNKAIDTVLTQAKGFPTQEVLGSRYGAEIYKAARHGYARFDDFVYSYGGVLSQAFVLEDQRMNEDFLAICEKAMNLINASDPIERAEGCLRAMHAAFVYKDRRVRERGKITVPEAGTFSKLKTQICRLLQEEKDFRVLIAGYWALCWLAEIRKPTATQTVRLLSRLWDVWQTSEQELFQRQCAWTIWRLPFLGREEIALKVDSASVEFLRSQIDSDLWMKADRYRAALVIGYYTQTPWSDSELIKIARSKWAADRNDSGRSRVWWSEFLSLFGHRGSEAIRVELERQRRKRLRDPRWHRSEAYYLHRLKFTPRAFCNSPSYGPEELSGVNVWFALI
jgi:hypothetical protein